jgi:hypothetical protein
VLKPIERLLDWEKKTEKEAEKSKVKILELKVQKLESEVEKIKDNLCRRISE